MAEQHSPIETYLLLARSSKGAATAKIITDATAANGAYVFSELLDVPSIKELQDNPSYEKQYRLLTLFAFGSLADYKAAPDSYPPLTPAHQTKLKQLTLVSLALRSRQLSYSELSTFLDVNTIRELENIIIDTIYAGLLGGKMYHHEQVLHVDWAASRDLSRDDLVKVQRNMTTWCENAQTLLASLDDQISRVRAQAQFEAEAEATYQRALDEAFLKAREENATAYRRRETKLEGKLRERGGLPLRGGMDLDDDDFNAPGGLLAEVQSLESMDEADTRAKKRSK